MGACSCLSWSHENTLSGKRTFQALWLPRVVRNVVCGFWIFTINRKESALKQLVPWLLEGQTYICMLEMSPVKFQLSLFPYYFFKDAEHHSFSCLLLRSANRSLHKVSFTHMAAWSLHFFFGSCILLLSLSLHCKQCTEQMLDKIWKSSSDWQSEWREISCGRAQIFCVTPTASDAKHCFRIRLLG